MEPVLKYGEKEKISKKLGVYGGGKNKNGLKKKREFEMEFLFFPIFFHHNHFSHPPFFFMLNLNSVRKIQKKRDCPQISFLKK